MRAWWFWMFIFKAAIILRTWWRFSMFASFLSSKKLLRTWWRLWTWWILMTSRLSRSEQNGKSASSAGSSRLLCLGAQAIYMFTSVRLVISLRVGVSNARYGTQTRQWNDITVSNIKESFLWFLGALENSSSYQNSKQVQNQGQIQLQLTWLHACSHARTKHTE
jgi:hypothetical protein